MTLPVIHPRGYINEEYISFSHLKDILVWDTVGRKKGKGNGGRKERREEVRLEGWEGEGEKAKHDTTLMRNTFLSLT